MNTRIALLLLAAVATSAQADIYQWKDDKGRIHFGEEVPAKYEKTAKKVETGKINTLPPEKRMAQPAQDEAPAAQVAAPDGLESSTALRAKTDEEVCREKVAAYEAARLCFLQYTNVNGSVKEDGFKACKNIPQPVGCNAASSNADRNYTP